MDEAVPIEQSQWMETALKKVGVPVKLVAVSRVDTTAISSFLLMPPDWELTLQKQ